jgi:hypothetical protein
MTMLYDNFSYFTTDCLKKKKKILYFSVFLSQKHCLFLCPFVQDNFTQKHKIFYFLPCTALHIKNPKAKLNIKMGYCEAIVRKVDFIMCMASILKGKNLK